MAESTEIYRPGLEGIIAGETSVSTVAQDSLAYRGYRIEDLAEHASFEEVAYLLLRGELPNQSQLTTFRAELDKYRKLPPAVLDTIKAIPAAAPGMDVLRTAVSMIGHFDPYKDNSVDALVGRATHVLAAVPTIIAARMRFLEGKAPIDPKPGLSHAAQFFHMAFGQAPTAINENSVSRVFRGQLADRIYCTPKHNGW